MKKLALGLAVLALLAAACDGGDEPGPEQLVVASFYPLAWVAEAIAGDAAEVVDLTPSGVEPHDLELAPSQVGMIEDADLVLYMGEGFQPAVEDVIDPESGSALDVLVGMALMEGDPHVWLDPTRLADAVDEILAALAKPYPDESASFEERAADLQDRLTRLDRTFEEGLADCARREIVTSHSAFGYLADRYDLEQIAISGLSPEAEPSPGRIAEVIDLARERGVTTIFFETLVSPDVAETIADEIGVTTGVLEPIETQPDEGDYVDAMERNLTALRSALGCR
ncbi:MAG: zinc ABC transporter substrate-binding protein [Actinobacteria bacterium]|nr:zinc ABC transporter substrate-binding protein [Actinomycetota bacterium]